MTDAPVAVSAGTWPPLAGWRPGGAAAAFAPADMVGLLGLVRHPLHLVRDQSTGHLGVATGGEMVEVAASPISLLGTLPPMYPEWLGDRTFCEAHGTRYPYVTGAMANGIATPAIVVAMAKAGMLGFFGAGGLSFGRVEQGLASIKDGLAGCDPMAWGANLIHSPSEVSLENRVAQLFIDSGVTIVEASAFMKLTPAVVHYALSGLSTGPDGRIVRKHAVFAKISRPEVASQFMSPAPADIVASLVAAGKLSEEEASLGRRVAVAEDITVESDSGGHTDNRPLPALFPEIVMLRDRLVAQHRLQRPVRVGAAGGLGTPQSVAGAFAMGAAYVVTGSINQACVESGLSAQGRQLLAKAGIADVMMAPAADMFELGVNLQVLKRGSMFGPRARKLYGLYSTHSDLDGITGTQRAELEKIFGTTVEAVWQETEQFWRTRDPDVLNLALRDPKYRMALVFRWYLGKSSRWAIDGLGERTMDYQIWCGPAMGAFNSWVSGSHLDPWDRREVVDVALNLLEGAAVITRAQQARSHGVPVPPQAFSYTPRQLAVAHSR